MEYTLPSIILLALVFIAISIDRDKDKKRKKKVLGYVRKLFFGVIALLVIIVIMASLGWHL